MQDLSGNLGGDISTNFNYSNTLPLQGGYSTYDYIALGTITKPTNFTTTLSTNFNMRITGLTNPLSAGYAEVGAWIKDVDGNIVANLVVGNNRDSSGVFDISNSTTLSLTPSQFPLSVQEYAYYIGWAIYGNVQPFTCDVVMTVDYPSYDQVYYNSQLNKFGYSTGSSPSPSSNANTILVSSDTSDTTCFITFVNDSPTGSYQSVKANSSLTYDASNNQLAVPRIKPTVIIDASNNAGVSGNILSSSGIGTNWISSSSLPATYSYVGGNSFRNATFTAGAVYVVNDYYSGSSLTWQLSRTTDATLNPNSASVGADCFFVPTSLTNIRGNLTFILYDSNTLKYPNTFTINMYRNTITNAYTNLANSATLMMTSSNTFPNNTSNTVWTIPINFSVTPLTVGDIVFFTFSSSQSSTSSVSFRYNYSLNFS